MNFRHCRRAVAATVLCCLGLVLVAVPAHADLAQPADAWHPQFLNLAEAHRHSTGAGVTVALLGGDVAEHRDLRGALLPAVGFVDKGEEGKTAGDDTPAAGVLAARGDGRNGLLGVAPGAKVLPVRIAANRHEVASASAVAKGILVAVERGAKVICVTPYRVEESGELASAVRRAVAAGVVVVAPIGPGGDRSGLDLPGVVMVDSIDRQGRSSAVVPPVLAVDIYAPGENIVFPVSFPDQDAYVADGGAELAAAIVAGTAALVRGRYPDLSAADVIRRLATTRADAAPRRDPERGWGVVNPVAALTAELFPLPAYDGRPAAPSSSSVSPRDRQWYLDAFQVPHAHRLTRGRGVLVGMVVDNVSRVDGDHPDLRGQVETGTWVDQSGKIRTDPLPEEIRRYQDSDLGGYTGAAGMIVAKGAEGLLGVAPEARVVAITCTTCIDRDVVGAGVRWLVDRGVRVVVLAADQLAAVDAIRYALSRDVVVVAAVSADGNVPRGVVTVAGIGRGDAASLVQGRPAIAAPGKGLYVASDRAIQRDGYTLSVVESDLTAAAYVAGAVALVRAQHPELGVASVVNRLLATAVPATPGSGAGGQHKRGIVDPFAAVTAEVAPVAVNPLGDPGPPEPSLPGPGSAEGRSPWLLTAAGTVVLLLLMAGGAAAVLVWRRRTGPGRAPGPGGF